MRTSRKTLRWYHQWAAQIPKIRLPRSPQKKQRTFLRHVAGAFFRPFFWNRGQKWNVDSNRRNGTGVVSNLGRWNKNVKPDPWDREKKQDVVNSVTWKNERKKIPRQARMWSWSVRTHYVESVHTTRRFLLFVWLCVTQVTIVPLDMNTALTKKDWYLHCDDALVFYMKKDLKF